VPAPANAKAKPINIAVSIVDKVQGLRMWITPRNNQNPP
jgi:hypothetical protein